MYAKLIEGELVEAPYYMKIEDKDIFGYNLDSNAEMLVADGYKLVEDTDAPSNMKQPRKIWVEKADKIIATWVDDYVEPTIEELKITKREEINGARDRAEQGGFEYMGKIFDSDPVSCLRITAAAQAMSLLPASDENKITWTTQDNSTIDLTAQELMGLVGALAEWSNTCHQKATALKAQIDVAKTAEELDKIIWENKPSTLL